ncbi:MAG: thioesterase family protein [Actinobacteria bacterium]|nr:thioesterase family protein [Actinomycetota bacterium]
MTTTAPRPGWLVPVEPTGPGTFATSVPPDWWGFSGAHGGLLGGLAVEAATSAFDSGMSPQVLDLRLLARVDDTTLVIEVAPLHRGRSLAVADVVALQGGRVVASATVTFAAPVPAPGADGVAGGGLDRQGPAAPEVPTADRCAPFAPPAELVPFAGHLSIRPAAGPLPLSGADQAEMTAWVGIEPDHPVTPGIAVVLTDALPPGIYPLLTAPVAVPTVQLSVHLHTDLAAAPVDGPLLVRQRNVSTRRGWSIDETDMWSRTGRLIGQGRQLRRVLP